MPEQPNNQEREEKTKPESYSQTKPIRERFAGVFGAIATLLGFVAVWATMDNHRTTLIWTIIAGIISCGLAVYFHWTPSKKQGDGTNTLDDSLTQLRLTTPLSIGLKPESKQNPPEPFKGKQFVHQDPPTKRQTEKGMGGIPFHTTDPYIHRYYIEEQIENVIWRWQYQLEYDNAPRNLTAFCRECRRPMIGQHTREVVSVPSTDKHYEICEFWCVAHPRVYRIFTDMYGDFVLIKEHIQQKIKDGSWLEGVNNQRMLRGETSISPSLVAALAHNESDELDKIKTDILLVLWGHSPSCAIHDLLLGLIDRRQKKNESSLDGGTFYYHMDDLVEKKFVEITYDVLKRPDRCSLTQKARQYILDNNLLNRDEKAN